MHYQIQLEATANICGASPYPLQLCASVTTSWRSHLIGFDMAGDWMKIQLELPDKPEVHYISGICNLEPDTVVGKLIRVWQWFNKHTTDGNAVGVTFALVDRLVGVTGFAEAMHLSGWLEHNGSTLTMPKFDRHTSESAKKRALSSERQSRFRNAPSVTNALPREEKRREEVNLDYMSGKPDASKQISLNSLKPQAIEVLDFLNTKTGRNYQPVEANLKMIAGRLKEGASVADCRAVIAKKVREWGSDAKMSEYLRPATLFNATKFAQYRGELVEASND